MELFQYYGNFFQDLFFIVLHSSCREQTFLFLVNTFHLKKVVFFQVNIRDI